MTLRRITRRHLTDDVIVDTISGPKTIQGKVYKGLIVTPSLTPNKPGFCVTHVASGKTVGRPAYPLNQAWSTLLGLLPLTDWTLPTVDRLASHVELTPRQFYESVRKVLNTPRNSPISG